MDPQSSVPTPTRRVRKFGKRGCSIANTLLSADDRDADGPSTSPSPASPPRGVREDLSDLTDALANRFQGLASFLAPPTPGASRAPNPADIAARFRAGLARLPSRQAVLDLASSLLPPEEGFSGTEAAGVTEDVVAFARDAAMRPDLWLDFPLLPDDDFDMTDAQQDHALAVESLAPELPDLRIELCPTHMSEACFWKIYFLLLHPKLTTEDAQLLSTPQILEAREQLSQNFQYQTKLERNEDTVAPTFSSADGTVPTHVEVLPSLKDQDASVRATSFGNIDYGILQTIHLDASSEDTISDAGAVSSDNTSSSVHVQLVPVLRDATELSQSGTEESIHALSKEDVTEFSQSRIGESTADFTAEDAGTDEQAVTLVDGAPLKDDERKPQSSDLSEQSRVVIQKADNNDIDADGDEWLEEDAGGSGSTHIQIADDEEDVSFSDLEEDDDAVLHQWQP